MSSVEHSPTVRYWVTDHVARVELNRPASLNAWTPRMGTELLAAVRAASEDEQVHCVLLTGAGAAFSAGADVKSKRELTPEGHPDLSTRLLTIYNPIVSAIRESPKPYVAAVHGACAGLGVSLALACDLLVAAPDAYFLLAFIRIGVMPDGGSTSFLAERVGSARAAELCMLGERLSAAQAEQWGLVHHLVDAGPVEEVGLRIARQLADQDPSAIGHAKTALTGPRQDALAAQLLLEATLQQQHGPSFDYAEGRTAFKEKRSAKFIGA